MTNLNLAAISAACTLPGCDGFFHADGGCSTVLA